VGVSATSNQSTDLGVPTRIAALIQNAAEAIRETDRAGTISIGFVDVESDIGKGTRIRIWFPLNQQRFLYLKPIFHTG
jgi:hypothetical protein